MINIGNDKIKKLYKGDELVTRVFKGDELIFRDIESLYGMKITIDTRWSASGGPQTTRKDITISPWSQVTRGEYNRMGYIVKWGDGTETTYPESNWTTNWKFSHTYPEPGVYQITFIPNTFVGNDPREGWFSILNFSSMYQLISIDTPFPQNSVIVRLGSTPDTTRIERTSFSEMFSNASNLESVPENLIDGVVISPTAQAKDVSFGYIFYCTYKLPQDTGWALAKKMFQMCVDGGATGGKFDYAFYCAFQDSTTGTIPEDLFSAFTGKKQIQCSNMFDHTFSGTLLKSPDLSIPANLFTPFDTSEATAFHMMFNSTFTTGSWPNGMRSTKFKIPSGLFDFLDMTNATTCYSMFSNTFCYGASRRTTDATIPAGLFDHVSTTGIANLNRLFYRTFEYYPYTGDAVIPAGLFDNLDTSSATDVNNMFFSTFNGTQYGSSSTSHTDYIPDYLFANLDLSKATNLSNMFQSTFRDAFQSKTAGKIPTHLFPTIKTSNGVNFQDMFSGTFYHTFVNSNDATTLDADFFSFLDFQNANSLYDLFRECFRGALKSGSGSSFSNQIFAGFNAPVVTNVSCMYSFALSGCRVIKDVPANFFGTINTSACTNFSQMFNSALSSAILPNSTISEHLFDFLNTSSGTSFSEMFAYTFYGMEGNADVPGNIFDPIDTSSGINFSSMFSHTFADYLPPVPATPETHIIPANLFDFLNTSNGTNFSRMFDGTFNSGSTTGKHFVTIPATLFAHVDTGNATNTSYMFNSLFSRMRPTAIPEGLFGGIKVPASNNSGMFSYTFQDEINNGTYTTQPELKDVFYGMSDFSWATAANANSLFNKMFSVSASANGNHYTGSASTVLQHFNFNPTTRTYMFDGQTQLTDYLTINANWK